MSGTFGPLVHGGQLEDATIATLRKWSRTYLGMAEPLFGYQPEQLPDIRGWDLTSTDTEKWPETKLPALVLISPGLAGDPQRVDDTCNAIWDLRLAVIVSAGKEAAAHKLARVYAAVIRQCVLQRLQRDHSDTLSILDVWWTDERYDVLDSDRSRTLTAALLAFNVDVGPVVSLDDGPTTPDPLPDPPGGGRPDYPDTPTAEHINVTVSTLEE